MTGRTGRPEDDGDDGDDGTRRDGVRAKMTGVTTVRTDGQRTTTATGQDRTGLDGRTAYIYTLFFKFQYITKKRPAKQLNIKLAHTLPLLIRPNQNNNS